MPTCKHVSVFVNCVRVGFIIAEFCYMSIEHRVNCKQNKRFDLQILPIRRRTHAENDTAIPLLIIEVFANSAPICDIILGHNIRGGVI